MGSMLDVNSVCILAHHTICIYFLCVMWTHSLPFSLPSSVICISSDTWFAIFHFAFQLMPIAHWECKIYVMNMLVS